MTEQERQEILSSLESGKAALRNALQGVTEEMAARAPAPEAGPSSGASSTLSSPRIISFDKSLSPRTPTRRSSTNAARQPSLSVDWTAPGA